MRVRYCVAAAALGLCTGIAPAVRAQSVANSVTTGAVIPENEVAPAASLPRPERSQTVTVGVTAGLGETDNVGQTSGNGRDQTIALAGVDFGWIRTGSALQANVIGDLNYLDYVQGAFASQLLGRLDGQTSLSMLDKHVQWFLQDDFGEGQLDPYTSATPGNLEHINVVATGPEVSLRPGTDNVLQFGARYARSTYQISPLNGSQTSENVLFQRNLSPTSNIALGAQFEQLRFEDTTVNSDYDLSRYYLQYDLGGVHTHVTAALGEGQVNEGGLRDSTPMAEFNLFHDLTMHSSVNISAGRELTDAADSFTDLRSGAAGGIIVAAAPQTTGDYLRNYVRAGLEATGRRTTIGVTAYWERDSYTVDDFFDVTRTDVELRVGRQLTREIGTNVFASVIRSSYFNQDIDITTYSVGADVTWQASRTLSVAGRYLHNSQSSAGAGVGFASNLVFVTVTYRPVLAGQQELPIQQQ